MSLTTQRRLVMLLGTTSLLVLTGYASWLLGSSGARAAPVPHDVPPLVPAYEAAAPDPALSAG